jgi:hypothetical protein
VKTFENRNGGNATSQDHSRSFKSAGSFPFQCLQCAMPRINMDRRENFKPEQIIYNLLIVRLLNDTVPTAEVE